ncbi:hypothetical protein NHQ30_007714 [Ciborinia camelliae]|nr:hypothetical protein NHQ30_007714 [Ciborinia camelliae]
MESRQSGAPRWGIGPPSDRSISPQSSIPNNNSLSSSSSSSSSSTVRPLCPTAQISFLSLNPLAPPFHPAVAAAPLFFPPPPPPPTPRAFNYQQQAIDRQQEAVFASPAMAPLNLPTGQPAPNAFQFNNNSHGFPPSLASLQNTSQDSANSNDSFRTQVPLPWNLPSEYENNGAVAIPDPSPFADPPLPFATPDFNNGHDARAQLQPFANQNSIMNGASAGAFGHENGYQMPGQQNNFSMGMGMNMNMNGMNMNLMNGMLHGMNGMNGFNGGNIPYQSSPYNGQIGGPHNHQIGNGQMNQHQQHQVNFNGHGAPPQPNFHHPNMGMRPQLPQITTQFPANPYNSYSAPPMGMTPQQFYNNNGGGANNNFHGPSTTPGSASTMLSNLNFGSLSLGMSPNGVGGIGGIGPNGNPGNQNQNNEYSHSHSHGNGNGNGNANNNNNGMMMMMHGQNQSNGNFQAAPIITTTTTTTTNNNPAASARSAQYTSLPSVGNLYHPLPQKPQFHAQRPYNSNKANIDPGHHAYAAINSNLQPAKTPQSNHSAPSNQSTQSTQSAQSVVHTPQPQKSSVDSQQIESQESQQGAESSQQGSKQGSNSVQSPVSSNEIPVSASASEPRANFTPMLRSSRGKSITTSVDRAQQVNDWVQNTPTRASLSRQNSITSEVIIDDTPKMSTFNHAAQRHLNRSLERTPGAAGAPVFTPRPLSVNPFNPITTLAPFSPNSRFGRAPGMSPLLRELTRNGTVIPTAEEALEMRFMPFEEYCRAARPAQWGVMKIRNIPYSVTRQEILAFLGRNARIAAADDHEPIHIIMERVTSKTLDAYVEFISFSEAANAVQRFDTNRLGGRGGRLGQRHVEVELSSQEELMKQLFPKAKNVEWHGAIPRIIPRDPNDKYNSGFQGFVSSEELVMLKKHVESPQRSPFSKDCPQRPFECLISTLIKYPWAMVDHIIVEDRQSLFRVTMEMLRMLAATVESNQDPLKLNSQLFKRVWRTALKCQGFSPVQKDDIIFEMKIDPQIALELGVPPQADLWSYIWTIGPRKDVAYDLVQYYMKLISDATADKRKRSLAEKSAALATEVRQSPTLFGNLHKRVDHTGCTKLTMAQLALKEWTAFEDAISQALTPALEGGPSN